MRRMGGSARWMIEAAELAAGHPAPAFEQAVACAEQVEIPGETADDQQGHEDEQLASIFVHGSVP